MTNLFPIRIDVSSNDKTVRLVDTLLIDPTCLPTPLTVSAPLFVHDDEQPTTICNARTIDTSINTMAHDLARDLIADLEVIGMNRQTLKHFTGRVELMEKKELRRKVQQQIRDQLVVMIGDYGWQSSTLTRKRCRWEMEGDSGNSSNSTSGCDPGGIATKEIKTLGQHKPPRRQLVKINIRIRHGEVMLIDEFDWDPYAPPLEGGCPISVANDICNDLKLPPAMAVAIATSIVEQLNDVTIDEEPKITVTAPKAWKLDSKERDVADAIAVVGSVERQSVPGGVMKGQHVKWSSVKMK